MPETKQKGKLKGDGVIWAVFFMLSIISVVEVFSASSNLTYESKNVWGPVLKHVVLFGVGWFLLVVTMNVKCKYFKIAAPLLLFFSTVLLVLCFAVGSMNDGHRWIPIPGTGLNFQPSELAKAAVVMTTAQILSAMQTPNGADKLAFKYIMYMLAVFLVLIGLENLSTAAILGFVVYLMMWLGRVPSRYLTRLAMVVLGLAAAAVFAIMVLGDDTKDKQKEAVEKQKMVMVDNSTPAKVKKKEESLTEKVFHRMGTWKGRIKDFLNFEDVPAKDFDLQDKQQKGYANIAIASSNVVGRGPGNTTVRDYLPQAFSDYIYAVVVEELGIFGAAFVAFLYIVLLFRTAKIANQCVNIYPALLIMGFALLIVVQAMFNMMVAVGMAPVTGQPLPLVSKGGTSTIINCVYVGVILSVSCSAKKKDDDNADVQPDDE